MVRRSRPRRRGSRGRPEVAQEYRLRHEPRGPKPVHRRSGTRAVGADRRRSRRRRGHALQQGAARPDLGPDPADRARVGRPLSRVRGAVGAASPFVYFAVSVGAIAVFAGRATSPCSCASNSLDILLAPTLSMIPLGGFLDVRRASACGASSPRSGALVFGDVRARHPLVRRVPRRLPRVRHRGRDPRRIASAAAGLVHDHDARAQHRGRRHDGVHAARALRQAAPGRLDRAADRAGRGREPAPEHPAALDRRQAQGSTRSTIADQFSSASILFADVVDFTPRSEHLAPAEVVGLLDHLFSHFDELAERYGLEKIKTIGDCYMVAAGVPTPRPDHARALALMALDMVEAMRSSDEVGHLGLELRVGINSGPVVAGVIGRKRFLYDLWGDAVNTASRMESHGTPGADPDHAGDVRAARGRVRLRAAGHDRGQGQGRDGGLVRPRASTELRRMNARDDERVTRANGEC